jgi:hypothetical protein
MRTARALTGVVVTLLVALQPAVAAERRGRLTVEVKVTGQEQWRNAQGTDHATVRFSQTLSYSTVVQTDGEIVDFNTKDPNYGQQQMAQAAGVARAVVSAQGQKPMTQAEFQDRVQKGQQACKGDQQCLMDLAMQASQWSNQVLASQSATAPPQQGSGSYLNYFGFENCGSRIQFTINDVSEGAFADVQGPVPFTVKKTANYSGNENERLILCAGTQLVVDPEAKMLYTDGITVGSPRGVTLRTQRGRTTEFEGEMPLKGEAFKWASEQLRRAPLSGTRKGTVKITSPQGSSVPFATTQGGGTAQVEMTWRFEEIR